MEAFGFAPTVIPWAAGGLRVAPSLCRRTRGCQQRVWPVQPIRAQSFPPSSDNGEVSEMMSQLGPDEKTTASMPVPSHDEADSSRVGEPETSSEEPDGKDATWLESVLSCVDEGGQIPEAFQKLKTQAISVASATELPTRRMEPWRFTDLRKLFALRFSRSKTRDICLNARDLMPKEVGTILTFVDGVYAEHMSVLEEDVAAVRDAGGHIGSIHAYNGSMDEVMAVLDKGENSITDNNIFAVLSSALAQDACVIDIPGDFAIEKPVGILNIASGGLSDHSATISSPRLAILAKSGSKATILEYHRAANPDERPWFCTLPATGVSVSPNAKIEHYLVGENPDNSHLISHVHSDIAGDASYTLRPIGISGQILRINARLDLNGPGGHAGITGILIADRYHISDLHSCINHFKTSCTSNQIQKNVASDHARAIFNGKIIVARGADGTDSKQLCRSMLLSDKAQVDAMPVMEIMTDEVKCSHGATVADLVEEELFYCQSRGLNRLDARKLLTQSFVLDLLKDSPFDMLRERISECALSLNLTASGGSKVNPEGPSQ